MPRRQRIIVKKGRGRRGGVFGQFTNFFTAETYRTYGLTRFLPSGKVSKVRTKVRRKK